MSETRPTYAEVKLARETLLKYVSSPEYCSEKEIVSNITENLVWIALKNWEV